MLENQLMQGPPSYNVLISYARKAVQEEYWNSYHGKMTGYDTQSVLAAMLNHFGGVGGKLALEVARDEELIRDVVRIAEQEFNEKYEVEL